MHSSSTTSVHKKCSCGRSPSQPPPSLWTNAPGSTCGGSSTLPDRGSNSKAWRAASLGSKQKRQTRQDKQNKPLRSAFRRFFLRKFEPSHSTSSRHSRISTGLLVQMGHGTSACSTLTQWSGKCMSVVEDVKSKLATLNSFTGRRDWKAEHP